MASRPALRVASLCAGIGCADLGLAACTGGRARTVVYVEREVSAVAILAARMDEGRLDAAPVWSDLRTFDARAWCGAVDCVVAGFPCTDISVAGKGAGLAGEHSGLWFHVLRCIRDMGPGIVVLENVAVLARRGLDVVLGGLASLGFDAEWGCLRASDVGAPHARNRFFLVAYRDRDGLEIFRGGGLRDGGGVTAERPSPTPAGAGTRHGAGTARGGDEIA